MNAWIFGDPQDATPAQARAYIKQVMQAYHDLIIDLIGKLASVIPEVRAEAGNRYFAGLSYCILVHRATDAQFAALFPGTPLPTEAMRNGYGQEMWHRDAAFTRRFIEIAEIASEDDAFAEPAAAEPERAPLEASYFWLLNWNNETDALAVRDEEVAHAAQFLAAYAAACDPAVADRVRGLNQVVDDLCVIYRFFRNINACISAPIV